MTIKEKLSTKTLNQLAAIAKRLKYPLRGNKREQVNSLNDFFLAPQRWKAISNG